MVAKANVLNRSNYTASSRRAREFFVGGCIDFEKIGRYPHHAQRQELGKKRKPLKIAKDT